MLVIRDQQIDQLERNARAVFRREVALYIGEHHGSLAVHLPQGDLLISTIPEVAIRTMVRTGIDRAAGYGIRWKSTQASFVTAMFVVAPNFDEDPLVHELLSDERVKPDHRMYSVVNQLSSEHWRAIRERYDVHAWGLAHG